MGLDDDLGLVGGLVGAADAGELLDLAGAGLLVEALGVAPLGDLEGHINIDLHKRKRLFIAVLGRGGVQVAGELAVGAEGGDEGGDGDGGRVGEELGDLADAADVLLAVGLGEAQVPVQAEADVVAVEPVRGHAEVQQVLLERRRHRRLAARRQAREPEREALLAPVLGALAPRQGRVPGYVAIGGEREGVLAVLST